MFLPVAFAALHMASPVRAWASDAKLKLLPKCRRISTACKGNANVHLLITAKVVQNLAHLFARLSSIHCAAPVKWSLHQPALLVARLVRSSPPTALDYTKMQPVFIPRES